MTYTTVAVLVGSILAIVFFVWLFIKYVCVPTASEMWLCEQESKKCQALLAECRAFRKEHEAWMKKNVAGYKTRDDLLAGRGNRNGDNHLWKI